MCKNCSGDLVESRFTPPRPDCPFPEDWHSRDSDSTENEVIDTIASIVRMHRPRKLVVETGTAFGMAAKAIGHALMPTQGRLISFEVDPARYEHAVRECAGLPVEIHHQSSLDGLRALAMKHAGEAQVIFLDSLFDLRPKEMELAMPLLAPGGWILVHDCGDPSGTKYPGFSTVMYDKAESLGLVGVSAPTPRGFTIFAREA